MLLPAWFPKYAEKGRKNDMRIMFDTNVLISLLLFPNVKMNAMMEYIFTNHQLVLASFVVEEPIEVTKRKFPAKIKAVDRLLSQMSYELAYTPEDPEEGLFEIRDAKDYPVLYTAIAEDVDILITGDKDFADVDVERPEIVTPREFIEKYL